ncbi:hypothetical protein QQ045_026672 [Rhodiola kirilowii]
MQYVPGIHSTRDLYAVADHDGIKQHLCNVNTVSGCSPYYNTPLFPSLTTGVLLNTEVVKQTILGHEAIFRHQVTELHRLYGKQRELMNELRSDLNQQNTQVRLASSECGWAEQKESSVLWLNPPYVSQPVTLVQPPQLEVGKKVHTDRGTHEVECASQQCELLYVRCKKYNNKVLDLQLLGTEYMDDEDDRLAEATQPERNMSSFSATIDEQVDHQPLRLDIQEKGIHAKSASARPIFFDLNEPFEIEEETFQEAFDYGAAITSNEELPVKNIPRETTKQGGFPSAADTDKYVCDPVANIKDLNNPDGFLVSVDSLSLKPKSFDEHPGVYQSLKRSSKKRTSNSGKSEGCRAFSGKNTQDTLITVPKSLQLVPTSNKTEARSKNVVYSGPSMFDFRRNPIAVQALPCTNAAVLIKERKSKLFLRATRPDGDNNQLSEILHHTSLTNKGLPTPLVDHIKKAKKSERGRRSVRARNVSQDSNKMRLSTPRVPVKCTLESFPKAPFSPENEECSPPREESDENLLETRSHVYSMEDRDEETDVAKSAAKAIVCLSAADVHINRCSVFETSCFSPNSPLHWFAEVVSSADSTTGLPPSGESRESFSDDLDYFETMTLKLEDTSTEEQYEPSIAGQDDKLRFVMAVSGQIKRARGRRSRKLNNFQSAVLPSISYLSRHEVTEDLQLIEGLMEAAGTPTIRGLKRRTVSQCGRGRKQMSYAASAVAETSPCLLLDLQNKSSDYDTSERRRLMIDWGKITRRRRGQRFPARKLTFSQVAPSLRAH